MSDRLQSDKPIARTLCGWCGSGDHERCKEKDGYIRFTLGVHSGNQCKCHDAGHGYQIERGSNPNEPKARRKSGR